jgi:hypothetical protein
LNLLYGFFVNSGRITGQEIYLITACLNESE